MDLEKGMAEQVASDMPRAAAIAANRWLPEADMRVYAEEYGRPGFQGGRNGYRGSPGDVDRQVFAGRTIDVSSTFTGGKSDWGVYQTPGALDRLEKTLSTNGSTKARLELREHHRCASEQRTRSRGNAFESECDRPRLPPGRPPRMRRSPALR